MEGNYCINLYGIISGWVGNIFFLSLIRKFHSLIFPPLYYKLSCGALRIIEEIKSIISHSTGFWGTLKGSPKKNGKNEIKIFTDANWAGLIEGRRLTTGYCTFVWENLITWKSKKRNIVARSRVEAEFRAIAQWICERLWLKKIKLLEEL